MRRRVKVPWTIRSEVNADWPVRPSAYEHPVGDLLIANRLFRDFVGDLLIAIFDDPDNRGLETAPTRDHKVTIPNVCVSDRLIAIFETDHAENRSRLLSYQTLFDSVVAISHWPSRPAARCLPNSCTSGAETISTKALRDGYSISATTSNSTSETPINCRSTRPE